MNAAFMTLLGIYVAHSVYANRYGKSAVSGRVSRVSFLLQAPLFAFSFYYGARQGVFSRDLVSPLSIGAGLAAGHLIFGISLLVTHRVLSDAATHFFDFGAVWRFLIENPALLLRFFSVSLSEEMVYRVTAQPILAEWLHSSFWAIAIVAAGFSVVHQHFFRNTWSQSAEFLGFALLLGAVYYWTGSLMLVIVIHTLRNLESVYLEYLVKVEELGDEAQAMNAIEAVYTHRPSETL